MTKKNKKYILIALLIIVVLAIGFGPQPKVLFNSVFGKEGVDSVDLAASSNINSNRPYSHPATIDDFLPLKGLDGDITNRENLKGKVVFMNLWALWCQPCLEEMPSISALRDNFKYDKNVAFLIVEVDGKLKASSAFVKNNNYRLPYYLPVKEFKDEVFNGNLPTTIIFNKKGQIVFRQEGIGDYNSAKMKQLLNGLAKEHL
jgi:thiol-disulfide isomerase/thioredoxin